MGKSGGADETRIRDLRRDRPEVRINSLPFLLCHFCVTYLHNPMQFVQTVGTVQTAPFLCKSLIIQ